MSYPQKKSPRPSRALKPDPVREAVSREVVRRLREDTAEEWGFNAVFLDVAHSRGVFHQSDPKRYNSFFGSAEKAANGALGRPFVQRALERKHQRPAAVSSEQAALLTRRILGEREEESRP